MNAIKYLYLSIVAILLAVTFQNCGEFQAPEEEVMASYINTQSIGDDVLYSTNLIVDLNQTEYTLTLKTLENDKFEYELEINSIVRNQPIASFKSAVFAMYSNYQPLVAHKSANRDDGKYFYFLSNEGTSLLMLELLDGNISIHWELDLPSPVNYNEFITLSKSDIVEDRFYMVVTNSIIHGSLTQNPTLEVCNLANYDIQADRCVGKIRTCNIQNGMGQSQFNGTIYGNCRVVSCNMSFHISQNQCDPDVISCPVTNGTGTRTWNRNAYDPCLVATCNQGYHLLNNQCDPNVINCQVANGAGSQTWNPATMDYGNCMNVNCNSGYHANNAGTRCLSNVRSCNIANGTGEQRWVNGQWGACSAVSCDNSYERTRVPNTNNQWRCTEILDGSRVVYVQATNGMTTNQLKNLCSNLPGTMNPVGCVAGEARDANNGNISFTHGVWGSPSQAGTYVTGSGSNHHFCYKPGQKRDNDGTDILVGIKCANVPNNQVNFP